MNNKKKVIVFPHVDRTGGSSIHAWFYPLEKLGCYAIHTGDVKTIDSLEAKIVGYADTAYIGGHFTLSNYLDSNLSKKFAFTYIFGVVRPTLDRFISMYKLWKRSPEWMSGLNEKNTNSLDSLYQTLQEHYFNNRLCRTYSSGGTFDSVMESILTNFSFVGSTQRLDLVAQRLKNDWPELAENITFNTDLRINVGSNVTDDELRGLGLDDGFVDMLIANNLEDQKLIDLVAREGGLLNLK